MFNNHFNNKMCLCSRNREVPKTKLRHFVIKDGKRIWVDGPKPNKYKGLDASKMDLTSRIEAGTFENHEGVIRSLEKIEGSDYLINQLSSMKNEYDSAKSAMQKKKLKEDYEKLYQDFLNANSNSN